MDQPTRHAPSARATAQQLASDRDLVASQPGLTGFLASMAGMVAVLNPERQIVFATEGFRGLTPAPTDSGLLGLRPGEALGCIHAARSPGGCGTSEHCQVCGAVNSILESQTRDARAVEACRLTVLRNGAHGMADLEVTSAPWHLGGRTFTVFSVRDTGAEKRTKALERIFFHDIVNTAGGLSGVLDLLAQYPDLNQGRSLVDIGGRSSRDILEEILTFRQLRQAESGELIPVFEDLDPSQVVREASEKIRYHQVAEGRALVEESDPGMPALRTDRLLLERILINMLKNAFEAVPPGAVVTVGCHREDGRTVFTVRNPGTMSREVQLQVFQRSFSTKREDRGLGTYSMRLLGENHLKGSVTFRTVGDQTEFRISLP